MIGEVADVDPLAPALAGLPHPVGGLVVGLRDRVLRPAQRDEDVVALLHPGAGPRLAALQPDAQVGGQPQRRMRVGILVGPRDRLAVGAGRVLPAGADAVVVERRLAAHHELDGAAHAPHRAQQDVFGVPVHRGAAMGARPRLDVVPRAHHQRVAHDQPAGVGLPRGLQNQAAGQVAARGRHRHAVGPSRKCPAPRSRMAPNTLGESGRGTHIHSTEPADEIRQVVLAVRQERVVGDRRETGSATIRSAHTAPGPSR